jgi:hypothetical protein
MPEEEKKKVSPELLVELVRWMNHEVKVQAVHNKP